MKEVEAEKKLDVDEANSRPKEGFEQLVRKADVHEEQILQDFTDDELKEDEVAKFPSFVSKNYFFN